VNVSVAFVPSYFVLLNEKVTVLLIFISSYVVKIAITI
jgi:hypothetical protein